MLRKHWRVFYGLDSMMQIGEELWLKPTENTKYFNFLRLSFKKHLYDRRISVLRKKENC